LILFAPPSCLGRHVDDDDEVAEAGLEGGLAPLGLVATGGFGAGAGLVAGGLVAGGFETAGLGLLSAGLDVSGFLTVGALHDE
jgi:hypothetical protein